MTKTISLSDEAYALLSQAKRPGESFSDVAVRLARLAAQEEVFSPDFKLEMSDEEAEAWKASIYAERDRERKPGTKIR
ncbi:MAG TPA: antitoxin VapB family protein [Candidatus Thermoplasmatota archaeon]|nr:antitoxin VapB family protein [Candidatus Thermoplasmatota archaeon]